MNGCFPGFEPDACVRQELRFFRSMIDLRQFDKIFISVSGGKDSHAMLFTVAELADKQGVPREKLLAMYADTGMEWHNAGTHVEALCRAVEVELVTVKPVRSLIEQIRMRIENYPQHASFPSPSCRFCTSHQKVDPMDKFTRQFGGKLLKVTGERWAESKARAGLPEFSKIPRISTATRAVYGWRPMLAWSESDIWAKVKETGVARHRCYDLGCGRLGCAGCIFSKDHELRIEMRENPLIFEALDKLEIDSGYTMSMDKRKIRERIKK